MREEDERVPSPDAAPKQGITIEEVLAQLDRVGYTAPGSKPAFNEEGLAKLRAWMAADEPSDGDSTGPTEPTPQ